MRTLQVSELKAGMRFTEPVYVDGTNLLVPKDIPLKEKDIQRLLKWNILEVLTDGVVKQDDATAAVSKDKSGFAKKAFIGSSQDEIEGMYEQIRAPLSNIFERIQNNEPVEPHEINTIVDMIMKQLSDRRNDLIQYILFGMQGESGYVENAINSCVLSILIGTHLNLPRHKANLLASGALLHDVGMLRVPKSILEKKEALTSSELQQIKTHPVHSYRVITKEIKLAEEAGLTALQHQERWDGQGYPKGLKGKDITIFARIVAVADAFEAMVSARPYRDPMIGFTAMRTILSDNGRRFDPEILKVFIKGLGIYPIGSIVLLSDASIGRVVENHPDAPLRPKIRVMIDSLGKTYLNDEGEVLDLLEDRSIFIARAVDPKELQNKA